MSRRPEPRVDSAIAMAVRRGYLYTLGVLALGVVLLIWPEQARTVSYYAAAAVVILIGLWRVIRYFREDPVTARERQLLATGIMRIILGGLMLLYATKVQEKGSVLLQAICGAGLLVIGGIRMQAAFDLKRRGYAQWYLPLAVGAVSLILGVLSTQTYAQGVWSGKSDSAARKGSLLSALLIPPIGIACILIGLYMRGHCVTADELAALQAAGQSLPEGMTVLSSSSQVFPVFAVICMPKLLGGVVLGTLFMTVVGGGSGLALGMASILVTDIFARKSRRVRESSSAALIVTRGTILAILVIAAAVAILVPGAMINDFGFLSMGLRGAVVFLPLCGGLWLKGKIAGQYAVASIVAGPVAVLAGKLLGLPFDPLFLGMAVCAVIMVFGLLRGRRAGNKEIV